MKQTVDEYTFKNAFRARRPDNFTWGGLSALYEHLIELENDTGQELELDVVALCCDFSEYKDFDEIRKAYDIELCYDEFGLQKFNVEDEVKAYLRYNGSAIIEHDEGVIINNF
tara:strand:+ start:711 stop:1049 length:339 start_codon:yes stop_codon:yes gene_type:complete